MFCVQVLTLSLFYFEPVLSISLFLSLSLSFWHNVGLSLVCYGEWSVSKFTFFLFFFLDPLSLYLYLYLSLAHSLLLDCLLSASENVRCLNSPFSGSILDLVSICLVVYLFHTHKQPVGLSDVCYLECSVSKFPLCLGSILDLIY